MCIEDTLDKDKCYCNLCLKENIITELEFNPELKLYIRPKCKHNNIHTFYMIKYIPKYKQWSPICGLNPNGIPSLEKRIKRQERGECSICHKIVQTRDSFGRCTTCHNDWYNKHNSSESMIKQARQLGQYNKERMNIGGICKSCHKYSQTLSLFGLCNKCSQSQLNNLHNMNTKPGVCPKCQKFKQERNSFGICSECQSQIVKITELTIRNMLNQGKIDKWPGCSSILQFIEKDNILYYYDTNIHNYIIWEEYKQKFKIQNVDFQLPNSFKLYITFRTQESENWSRAKQAFERSLMDSRIGWFVYIKFYIDSKNSLKPLVVGKTGSKLVNQSGTDISFSTNINDGPARRFLHDENLQWCKTQIAICSCQTEQKAYELEKEIKLKFNLFYS